MNMSTKAGEPRQDFPQAAIQEFKVFTSQAPAEYGGRAGGVINVVTKSGTNTFSGEGYEFLRNKAMNKVDKFTQAAVDAGQGTDRYKPPSVRRGARWSYRHEPPPLLRRG
jgi:hypothetical protein